MLRSALTFSLILTVATLAGCVRPTPLRTPQAKAPVKMQNSASPTSSPSQAVALATEDDGIPFYELTESYGLDVSLDLVTGRRVCTDGTNEVVVMPSARRLVINDTVYPMKDMIRWRNGVLYLPGESRSLLAEHLRSVGVPAVADAPGLFNGSEVHLAGRQRKVSAPTAQARRGRSASLPTAWRNGSGRAWNSIVLHHSATSVGCASSFHREHSKKWKNGLGYHFVIGNGSSTPDGHIEVGSRWTRQGHGIDGAHAGNKRYNKYGVGICLVGAFGRRGPTVKQLEALRTLCRALMARYGIPKSKILQHKEVRKGHTDCPGKAFPFDAFVRSL
jgi:predicted small lipoprotein YifL